MLQQGRTASRFTPTCTALSSINYKAGHSASCQMQQRQHWVGGSIVRTLYRLGTYCLRAKMNQRRLTSQLGHSCSSSTMVHLAWQAA
jgi:hypothetical protein